ncbi:MAG TPA: sigma 54-interacting transcriptional regulator, partial [Polyangiaceae bacterium]|nr:sigma 54-interacting transcriptional regulator [Polyangiaceae bacterium]
MSGGSTYGGSAIEDVTALLRHSFDPSPLPEPFRLTVVEGSDAGKTFALDGSQPSRVLVGTTAACAVRLSDRTVSRRHVALDIVGRRVRITDLGSTNGTRVNGIAINEALLEGGELILVGSTSFRLDREDNAGRVQISTRTHFGPVVGASTEMRRLYSLCERLAHSDVPVIIEGEPGSGKELMAEALHLEGPRAAGPFIVLDCTQVPPNLLEMELFGYEAGAFAGAATPRRGVFEQAHGGTLVIDEVGDMDPVLQPKLLRTLERQEVRPVGGNRVVKVNVRVVATTRSDLDREVQAGRFSEDLLQRLALARIELPPLRSRRGDIALLVRHFCRELQGDEAMLSKDLRRSWEDYAWPGNVRELRNALARHLALGELANITQHSGPEAAEAELRAPLAGDVFEQALLLPLGDARQMVVAEFERRYVERMLDTHGGNVTRAAESA